MSSDAKKSQQQYYTEKYRDEIESMRGDRSFIKARDVVNEMGIEDGSGRRKEVGMCLAFLSDEVDWLEPWSDNSDHGGRTYSLSPPEGGGQDA